ncbi:DNA mismatch repair protein [Dissophora ornata]|nr:DNA mismatch repair protein [Dissophora ornata]
MASIQPLAPGVAEELRASLVANSLEQCVAELVQNSIDANASSIEVKVDVAGHSLQVSDNGDGITAIDMERIGLRYSTSKCSTLQDLRKITTFGFRGEAIAALTEMSLVDIVSRPSDQEYVYSTIFKFPVRQRYWSEASSSKLELELDKVRRAVETLALIAPRISFTVIDMAKDTRVMICRKVDSQLHRITSVLGQALSSSLTYIKSNPEEATYDFSGYMSTVGHYNRLYQYIFLNNRPIRCENLQGAITQLFQQSSFTKDSLHYEQDGRRSRERHPVFVLTLKCPVSEYDICVDPSKVTVEFEDEERVLHVVRDTVIAFLERQHLLSRSAAATLRNQITTRKRKSRTKSALGESVPLGNFSRVKSSRPSKTAKAPRRENACCNEIDLEDELEFELDADWMASLLDDDFVSHEVEYSTHNSSGIMLPRPASERSRPSRTSLPHTRDTQLRPFNTGTSGIWAQDALRKWVNPVFTTPPIQVPSLQTLSLDAQMDSGEIRQSESVEKSISRFFGSGDPVSHSLFDIKSLQLSKECLQRARVVAQLDRKFILCTMDATAALQSTGREPRSTVLVVIDQHAADERVRVERLMKEMCICSFSTSVVPTESVKNDPTELLTHKLDAMTMIPPLPINLSRREWRLATQYSDWLYRWGIVLDKDASAQQTLSEFPEDSAMDEDSADTVIASHHFGDHVDMVHENLDSVSTLSTSLRRQEQPLAARARFTRVSTYASESDYSQGWVTALPRLVADRCVVDRTLTRDLIRDSIGWAEERRCSASSDLLGANGFEGAATGSSKSESATTNAVQEILIAEQEPW